MSEENEKEIAYMMGSRSNYSRKSDEERLDWLESRLMAISHGRATSSVDMSGKDVRGQFRLRGRNCKCYFRVNHKSIRSAIDEAMEEENK